jgi:cytochrome c-type biogenesis protein CcmE
MAQRSQTVRIGIAVAVVLGVIAWLAVSGIQANKSYYVTITELQGMGDKAYTRHLRVAGNVEPGSIERNGTHAQFVLLEQGKRLSVQYAGVEPPPDTFKDNAQALAIGTYGRDGVFHAAELQAKCASKYAPAQKPGSAPAPASSPTDKTASLRTPAPAAAN